MTLQQSLFILSCFQLFLLSWQCPFLSTLKYCLPTSFSVYFFFFLSLFHVKLSLLNQKTLRHLRHGQTTLVQFLDNIFNIFSSGAWIFLQTSLFVIWSCMKKDVEEGERAKASLPYSKCCSEPFSPAAVYLNCTCSLVIELLNSAN